MERRSHNHKLTKLSLAKSHSVPVDEGRRSEGEEMGRRRVEEEEEVDTSESLRCLQQEIESLLAPLTPLPDLEHVPKVRGQEKVQEEVHREVQEDVQEEVQVGDEQEKLQVEDEKQESSLESFEVVSSPPSPWPPNEH